MQNQAKYKVKYKVNFLPDNLMRQPCMGLGLNGGGAGS